MLILIPVALLLASAGAILVLQRIRPSFGNSWLVAAGGTLLSWVALLVLRWRFPQTLVLKDWLPVESLTGSLVFQLDAFSWPYAFGLASLVLAVVLTAAARLRYENSPVAWAGSMAIASIGIFTSMSANLLTLALGWTAIDLIELVVLLANVRESRLGRGAVLSFAARVAGTLLVLWSLMLSRVRGGSTDLVNIIPEVGVFLLLAAGLRLGVLPLYLPYTEEFPLRRGLGNVLRMVGPASSLMVLGRLPVGAVPADLTPWLLAFTALAVLYGSAMWLAAADEMQGRTYWVLALGGMAVACVIQGQPVSSIVWGVMLILSGGVLFLYSSQQAWLPWVPLLALASSTGLPFTPAALGWNGLVLAPYNLWDFIYLLAQTLLLAGYVRHLLLPRDTLVDLEGWARVVYSIGLFGMVLSQWLIGVFGFAQMFSLGVWWASPIPVLLLMGGWFFFRRQRTLPANRWLWELGRRVASGLSALLRLDWFYRLLEWFYLFLQRMVGFFTIILDGDGGVLWTLVLLALLATLLSTGGKP